jgi:ABC-type uncharacterized transport system substrate-binding protein
MRCDLRRREFIRLLGGSAAAAAIAWPSASHAQKTNMPVIGFLRSSTARGSAHLVAAFLIGLKEGGFVDGRNVKIEYRWANDQTDRLPELAAELIRHPVDVLFAGASGASIAAKAATSKTPIVFVTAADPVKSGLVTNLSRPGGNATGLTYLTSMLGGKRLELLRALVPAAKSVAVLENPKNATTGPLLRDIQSGGQSLGLQILVSSITSERDLDGVFATIAQQRPGALIVGPDPLFTAQTVRIVALAARYALPAIYTTREFCESGGLMCWGTHLTEQYRLGGLYTAKILKGANPAELPVRQPAKYEFVLNLKTAKALSLDVPPELLALADEVIE